MIGNTETIYDVWINFFIGDMSISKAYAIEFVMSLASLKVN